MDLPFAPPLPPMLAKLTAEIPGGPGWLYEPKWDGFRALIFRDGDEVYLQSRDTKPLNRYFPELPEALRRNLPERAILDGEIVIAGRAGLDFEALLLRIHPAASRVALLAAQTPASFVAWDLLAQGDRDLREVPFGERRRLLQEALKDAQPPVHLTPATDNVETAREWFRRFEGAGLDGVVAKRLEGSYQPDVRAMSKIKHARTADCVVGGFRWHKNGPGTMVGSLLLGLYDDTRTLHHVGIAASFTTEVRKRLVEELAPLRVGSDAEHPWRQWRMGAAPSVPGERGTAGGEGQRMPGASSRWNRNKDLSWEPLRIERVCEVAYDHLQGDRFRHATQFRRWRPDKPATDCRYDQLETQVPFALAEIFSQPKNVSVTAVVEENPDNVRGATLLDPDSQLSSAPVTGRPSDQSPRSTAPPRRGAPRRGSRSD